MPMTRACLLAAGASAIGTLTRSLAGVCARTGGVRVASISGRIRNRGDTSMVGFSDRRQPRRAGPVAGAVGERIVGERPAGQEANTGLVCDPSESEDGSNVLEERELALEEFPASAHLVRGRTVARRNAADGVRNVDPCHGEWL